MSLLKPVAGVADGRVERAPALVVLAPGDRVVDAHRAAARSVGRLVDRGEHVREAPDVAGEVVVLVAELPVLGQRLAGVVDAVRDLDPGAVERGGRAGGAGAEQVGQELPVGLGDDRRVDAEEAAAVLVVVLERGLLGGVQHVTGGVEEHHGAVALEVALGEDAGRAAGLADAEVVLAAEVLERVDALAGRAVGLAARLGEGEHAEARRVVGERGRVLAAARGLLQVDDGQDP